MKYVGLQTQVWRNNVNSVLLLILFPLVLFGLVFVFFIIWNTSSGDGTNPDPVTGFLSVFPWITAGVIIWFIIAWLSHTAMIQKATGSRPLERKANKRVYNLVENVAMTAGMKMPAVNIIEDDSLNAFASGISSKTYTISLSRGIIERLDDDELEAVIAHEMTHIRNRDVRLLIISIIFVGIFAFITEGLLRSLRFGAIGGRSRNKNSGPAIIIIIALAGIGWLLTTLFRFALSRKREYLADAGAAELTRKPHSLASALRKVSGDPVIEAVKRKDVAQMFIENPGEKKKVSLAGLFATHPPISKRISILEQF
ncbi:MAG: M48 family metallopeptidase [Bacteroidales bacterium]|nr:M48 family metallopeptidase [Bacteroidales bacterium]